MNQTQAKYIIKRLEEEYEQKRRQIDVKYPLYISDVDQGHVIKDNKLPLKYTEEQIRTFCVKKPHMKVSDLFDVDLYVESYAERTKRRDDAYAVLRSRVNHLKDQVMLGDAQDALELLNDFIKEEF